MECTPRWFPLLIRFLRRRPASFYLRRLLLFVPLPFVLRFLFPLLFPFARPLLFFPEHRLPFGLPLLPLLLFLLPLFGLDSLFLFVLPLLRLLLILLPLLGLESPFLFAPLPRLLLFSLPLLVLESPLLFALLLPPLLLILLPLLGLDLQFLFALPLPPRRLILLPFLGLESLRPPRRPRQSPLPEHVHVQMRNALARVRTAIDHDPGDLV